MSKIITGLLIMLVCLFLATSSVVASSGPAATTNTGGSTGGPGSTAVTGSGAKPETASIADDSIPNNLIGCTRKSLDLGGTISYLICVIRNYTTIIAVIIIMVVGLMYVLGGFKPELAGTAKTILTTTITGLIFLYLTSFIINFLALAGVLTK